MVSGGKIINLSQIEKIPAILGVENTTQASSTQASKTEIAKTPQPTPTNTVKPTPYPFPAPVSTLVSTAPQPTVTPIPSINPSCYELNDLQNQINQLKAVRAIKADYLHQIQTYYNESLKTGSSEQSLASLKQLISDLQKEIGYIDQQINSLKMREATLASKCSE